MKILVIGSGGREHALVWKLRQSPRVAKIYCAPGNGGIADEAECVAVDLKSLDSMIAIANRIQPDLTIVGPELPLMLGLVDEFTRRGWRTFGPTRAAAQLETSKSFAKEFLQRHRIPTAHYAICDSSEQVHDALPHFHTPIVVKADGLAAGKGVVIAKTKDEASAVAHEMLSGKMLGEAGSRVVLEEFLSGDELSFLVVSDGERVTPLVAAQDHKRVGDGDTGPNTGGMGAYTTRTIVDDQMRDWLLAHIVRPVIAGMKAEGAEYKGVLYCGLMMTARGPMVLEFNCRFGDPETQPILMRLESDLVEAIEASIDGRTSDGDFKWSNDAAVCVVMASGGYPGAYEAGKKIDGLEDAAKLDGVKVFHAGTSKRDGAFYTSGGRVLGVTARAAELQTALQRAYDACAKIGFEGAHYRKDIGAGTEEKIGSCSRDESHQQAEVDIEWTPTIMSQPLVSIVMGSDSDLEIMREAGKALDEFGIAYEIDVTSAHRSPDRTADYARKAAQRGIRVIIAGAGGAAHLAGVIAAHTTLPVIGVPIPSTSLQGLDSLLATVQMPAGIPVATVAIGKPGATNAGILAAQIIGVADVSVAKKLAAHKEKLARGVEEKSKKIKATAKD